VRAAELLSNDQLVLGPGPTKCCRALPDPDARQIPRRGSQVEPVDDIRAIETRGVSPRSLFPTPRSAFGGRWVLVGLGGATGTASDCER
jgi:hypothetical protein